MSASEPSPDSDVVPAAGSRFIFLVVGTAIVFTALAMLLEQIGLPTIIIVVMAALLIAGGTIVPGAIARTSALGEWLFARRRASSVTLGMAGSAVLLPGTMLLLLPGLFFARDELAPALVIAVLAAALLGGVAVNPLVRSWGAASPLEIVAWRAGGTAASLVGFAALAVIAVLFLWAELTVIGLIGNWVFGLGNAVSVALAAFLVAAAAMPGGLFAVMRTAALGYVFMAVAFLAAPVWIAATTSGFPVPQLVFGAGALVDIAELERQLSAIGIPSLHQVVETGLSKPEGMLGLAVFCLFVAMGLAVLPAALSVQQGAHSITASRRSAAWTVFLIGLVVSAAPAVAAYAKLALYGATLGLTSGEVATAAPWFRFWGAAGGDSPMIALCGTAIGDATSAISACGGNPDHSITPGDLAIRSEFVALALPQAAGLPFVFLLLAAMAVLAASLATAGATMFAGATLAVSLLDQISHRRARPQMRRLFAARAGGLAILAIAASLAAGGNAAAFDILLWALALALGLFAPALGVSLWSERLGGMAITLGMVAGAATLAAIWLLTGWGPDLVAASGDELSPTILGLPASVLAGLAALVVNCGVLALGAVFMRGNADPAGLEARRLPDAATRRLRQRRGLVE